MAIHAELFLYEELMLLALRDEKGTLEADDASFQYVVAAAFLAELLLAGHIAVEQVKKKKLVNLLRQRRMGDPLLDECITKMADAKRRASLATWVQRLARIKKLKHRVARQLCRRRILRADEDKVLLVFTRKIYPELDPRPERELIERLRHAIFTDAHDLDARTTVLVSLADAAGVLKNVFDKKELKARKARIKQIGEGEAAGAAAREAIAAMQAAVMVAVMVPVMVAATSS